MDIPDEARLSKLIAEQVAAVAGLDPTEVDQDRPLAEIGLASRDQVALAGYLQALLGKPLPPTLLWEQPTIRAVARHLTRQDGEQTGDHEAHRAEDLEETRATVPDAIAVVGLGLRLPGGDKGTCDDPGSFWSFLTSRGDGIGEVPSPRWAAFDDGSAVAREALAATTRAAGVLSDSGIAGFDAEFFGISPGEATAMDPQQRMLLEVSWEALENAGIPPRSLRGTPTGVFTGISTAEYAHLTTADLSRVDAWTATGSAASIAAGRISYLLDLRGPSLAVDTACSSSLVAVHLAAASLRGGDIDLALAGGVNLLLSPAITMAFQAGGATSPDGRCRAFDAGANGMVRGEGCGVVVLKRLADARRDGDQVLAVIAATQVNSDGRSNGLVAPNGTAQRDLLRSACEQAGIDPAQVDYVEAHGTGTPLGDPVEAYALGQVLGVGRPARRPLLLGAVKNSIGHLEAAAGVAGLIKTVLALSRGQIPPTPHFTAPSPNIPFAELNLSVVAEQTPWPRNPWPPIAGVSAFGFSGTNAHVILTAEQGTPTAEQGTPEEPGRTEHPALCLLSDASAGRVGSQAARLRDWLVGQPEDAGRPEDEPALGQIARTLSRRAGRGPYRSVVVARDNKELAGGLTALAAGEPHPQVVSGTELPPAPGVAFVFSGYGSAWPGMAGALAAAEPAFAAALAELEEPLRAAAGLSLTAAVRDGAPLSGVEQAQPVLFGIQVALAGLWASYGVRPAAVIGHSMGEVAAAVVCGAMSAADGARVIACRSRLLGRLAGGGAMALVGMPARDVTELAADLPDVHLAVLSSPVQTVVTGDLEQVGELVKRAVQVDRVARILPAEGAGHSPQVQPLSEELVGLLAGITPGPATLRFYSTVHEDPRTPPSCDAAYWAANLRRPVRLAAAIAAAARDGFRVFTEVSPHPMLRRALAETLEHEGAGDEKTRPSVVTGTLRRGSDETLAFHTERARLMAAGIVTNAAARRATGPVIDLPLAPWRHEQYWVRPAPRRAPGHPLLGAHVELPDGGHAWRAAVSRDSFSDLRAAARGAGTFPLSAAAEMVIAAACQAWEASPADLVLRELRLVRLRPLDAETYLTTTLGEADDARDGADGATVRIHMQDAAGRLVLAATAEVAVDAAADAAIDTERPAGAPAGQTALARAVDACLQAACTDRDEIPMEVRRLRVRGTAIDADGVSVARVADAEVPLPYVDKLIERTWRRRDLPPAASRPGRRWSLLAREDDVIATSVAATLREAGDVADVADVVTGEAKALEPGSPAGVVLLAPSGPLDVTAAGQLVLAASRIAASLAAGPQAPRLWVVTTGAIATAPGEEGEPGSAALCGLVRVLALEHPALRATLVDLDPATGTSARSAALAAELAADQPDDEVAWRDGRRLVARLTRPDGGAAPGPAAPGPGPSLRRRRAVVRPGSGYVVTGGYGRVGLATARWLAERGAGRIVLGSRSGPPPDAREKLRHLAALGADVRHVRGDISQPGTAERLVATASADGVPLRGVVHAAGVRADALVADLTSEALAKAWAPKVGGAWRLHEVTQGTELDWLVLCSSAAALLGSPGQAGYATANAWLDAFAAWRRAHGLPAASVSWGLWAGTADDEGFALPGIDPIGADEGIEALEALLATGRDEVGVVRLDAAKAAAAYPEIAGLATFGELLSGLADAEGGEAGRPAALNGDQAGPDAIRKRIAHLAATVLGVSPGQLRPDVPLPDAGLDSLAAVRIAHLIERDFGTQVDPAALVGGATIAGLAESVAGTLEPAAASAAGVAPAVAVPAVAVRRGTIEPRDAEERQVARVVAGVLKADPPGVTDDLGALGLTGARQAEVAALLAAETGHRLDAAALFGGPAASIASVAEVIRRAEDAAASVMIRELQPGGSRPPLILAHPAGGTCGVYSVLAGLLGDARPVLGLERIEGEVTERAARYAAAILERYPDGGWILGGWSFGGVLGYETARQLEASGHRPSLVVLLDAALPLPVASGEENRALARRLAAFAGYLTQTYGRPVPLTAEELLGLDEDAQLAKLTERMTAAGVTAKLSPAILRHQRTSHADTRALERYQPGPYLGRVVLYRATGDTPWAIHDPRYEITDPAGGWRPFCGRQLAAVPVDAHHLNLLDPPAVRFVASHLSDLLTHIRDTPEGANR